MPENKKKSQSIESHLDKLTEIVKTLEEGELSLEDSLAYFEEGISLTKECQSILEKAENKVKQLTEE